MVIHAALGFSKGLRPGRRTYCESFSCGRPLGEDLENDECPGGRRCAHGESYLAAGADRVVDAATNDARVAAAVTCAACLELLAQESAKLAESWERRAERRTAENGGKKL